MSIIPQESLGEKRGHIQEEAEIRLTWFYYIKYNVYREVHMAECIKDNNNVLGGFITFLLLINAFGLKTILIRCVISTNINL